MDNWTLLLLITFGGSAMGGLCRYLLGGFIARRLGERFPVGTMVVNVTGALLIGLVWRFPSEGMSLAEHDMLRDFLMLGVLGGYTTVSSFTLNTFNLLQEGEWREAGMNLFGTYFLCLGAVFAGAALGSGIW